MLLLPLRRTHLRHSVQRITAYSYIGKQFLTLTLDLGLGGMKIKTPHLLPAGERLDVKLALGDISIGLKGRTIYSHSLPDNQMVAGIHFLELSERDMTLLHDFLETLERWPKKPVRNVSQRKPGRGMRQSTGGKKGKQANYDRTIRTR